MDAPHTNGHVPRANDLRLIERLVYDVYEAGLVYEVCTRLVRPTV